MIFSKTLASVAASLLTIIVALPDSATAGLLINLNPATGMSADSISGFQAAADYWESVFIDDVEINIDIDFRTLGAGVLGQAGSSRQVVFVDDYFNALIADSTSVDDMQAIMGLPSLDSNGALTFRTQVDSETGSTAISVDSDGSANNLALALNTANAKAVGLRAANNAATDASITFSDQFSWDFDQSDGIGAGLQDFVGVAIHEIGHALGFTSGVDSVDAFIQEAVDNGSSDNLDDFAVFSGLDMFRYSSDDGVLDLSVGTESYFSLDEGMTSLGGFSTGDFNGDGHQASHWKDNLGLGIMDPTANPPGQINMVSSLDLQALDVIGWNMAVAVPEPSSVFALALLSGTLVMTRRRNAKAAVSEV